MLKPLKPASELFSRAYPEWIRETSRMIASSSEGTTFGVFGPWGSGKTSACMAMKYAVLNVASAPLQPKGSLAFAFVDCSALTTATSDDISSSIHSELQRAGVTKRSAELEQNLFNFFKKASEIGRAAALDPASKAGYAAVNMLADAGLKIEAGRKKETKILPLEQIEAAFVFLDDLDRCDANSAWQILRQARHAMPETKTIYIISCDPTVLGHHISHALGVPLSHGFQAVLKYIDVPLKIPVSSTPGHLEAIISRLQPIPAEDWQLKQTALEAVGSIPMRDILAALPQASLWLCLWNEKLRPKWSSQEGKLKAIGEVVFFFSLLHICLPNVAQVMGSGEQKRSDIRSSFWVVASGLTGPMKDSTQSAIEREFGEIAKEVVAGRMDLIRYSRARKVGDELLGVKVGPEERDVWETLWDLIRS